MTYTMTQRWRTQKPASDEHAPYYGTYVGEAGTGDLLETLERQVGEMSSLVGSTPESRGTFRYAEGKWSLKEVISHLTDSERVFTYRALRFSRADEAELPGFDENKWVPNSGADERTLKDLVDEFVAVRRASVALFRSMDDDRMSRRGVASGKGISARALAWIVAGHSAHHMKIIRERYL